MTQQTKSIIALVISTFLGALMGVWARNLGQHFELFQQIAVRALLGFLIGALFYSRNLNFANLRSAPRKDLVVMIFRACSLIIGISLFTFAIIKTSFANVNFIGALPMTAVIGVILFKERFTTIKTFSLILGFLGVVLISVKDFTNLSNIGIGELAVLLSTVFYSLAYASRKWMSKALSNQEMSVYSSLITGALALIISLILGNGLGQFTNASWYTWLIAICAGFTYLFIGYFNNIGFEHLEVMVANNIMALGSVFGLLIGLVAYGEMPDFKALIGGVLVVISAIIINYFKSK
jgi:drug/metabolite transporter (DMT)-like permease